MDGLGPREELSCDRRVLPLYSAGTARLAMSMDSLERQSELLLAEVMRRAGNDLVTHRFTDAGWDPRARRHLGPVLPARPEPASPPSATRKATPLMATLYAQGSNDRTDLLREVFADAANPAWEILDRAAALDALSRYASISSGERQELFGAATAVVWLAR